MTTTTRTSIGSAALLCALAASLLAACGAEGPRPFPHEFNDVPSSALSECTDAGLLEGIDVSKYDATVNWTAVRAAGVLFAFARVSDGLNFPDAYFDSNWSAIRSAGLIRGVYQYFEPNQDPRAQAALMLSHISDFSPGDLPPVIDVETLDGLDAGTAFAAVKAWVDDVHAALNVRPIIYTSARIWNEYGDPSLDADLWVANWQVSCPAIPVAWQSAGWTFWQYSATGTVSGETPTGQADLDRFNGSLAELEQYAGARASDGGSPDAGTDAGLDAGGADDAGGDAGGARDAGDADAGSIGGDTPPASSCSSTPTSWLLGVLLACAFMLRRRATLRAPRLPC